jgi:hypothetical protein
MEIPQVKPAGSYLLFEFIPRFPESRVFRFAPTPNGSGSPLRSDKQREIQI